MPILSTLAMMLVFVTIHLVTIVMNKILVRFVVLLSGFYAHFFSSDLFRRFACVPHRSINTPMPSTLRTIFSIHQLETYGQTQFEHHGVRYFQGGRIEKPVARVRVRLSVRCEAWISKRMTSYVRRGESKIGTGLPEMLVPT